METISNAAQTASSYIFGDSNKQTSTEPTHAGTTQTETPHTAQPSTEPISGQSGKGTVDEPFDAGNKHENIGSTNNNTLPNESGLPHQPKEAISGNNSALPHESGLPGQHKETNASNNSALPHESGLQGQHKEATSGNTSALPHESGLPGQHKETNVGNNSALPNESGLPGQQKEVNTEPKTESSATSHKPNQNPADAKNTNDVPDASQTPLKDPKDKEEDVIAKKDPNDHSGEPMHMHTGEEKKAGGSEGKEQSEEEKKKELEEKGTGEKWVKTSGLAADGGDFDATKPGAGKEADRLLEQKGIHKSEGEGPASGSDSKDDVKKPSKMEKIKEKLHIGGNKHT